MLKPCWPCCGQVGAVLGRRTHVKHGVFCCSAFGSQERACWHFWGSTWAILRPCWAILGRRYAMIGHLAPAMGRLGPCWPRPKTPKNTAYVDAYRGRLGPCCAVFGANLGHVAPSWGHVVAISGGIDAKTAKQQAPLLHGLAGALGPGPGVSWLVGDCVPLLGWGVMDVRAWQN